MFPTLTVDLAKLRHNTEQLVGLAKDHGVSIWGVTKVICGYPELGRAMLSGGVETLADSRLPNLVKLIQAGVGGNKALLRLPTPSEAEQVVRFADISLNSELITLQALSRAAIQQGREHAVIVMVDLGDLREGVWPDQVIPLVRQAVALPGLRLLGLGTNLSCYGGVIPTEANLSVLTQLAAELRREGLADCEIISGGNSSTLGLLQSGRLPAGINNLRIGEAIILGRETVARQPIPGFYTDAIVLEAEVVEVQVKPSVPVGEVGQDAFGNTPLFPDRGLRRRAVLAVGRQDVDPDGLLPLATGAEVIGASSDHLLLDVTECPDSVHVGDVLRFVPNYSALLRASTSPYVNLVWLNKDSRGA